MFFIASKLFWAVAQPGVLLLLLLWIGIVQLATSRGRRGMTLVIAVAAAFLVIVAVPLGEWGLAPLEMRFPAQEQLPDTVDGILLLGGAIDTDVTDAHGQVALNEAAERITETVVLARHYPAAPVVVSGGNGAIFPGIVTEAAAMGRLLIALGVADDRLILEDRSRNTFENAEFSKAIVGPKPGQRWLLVTSAAHMPRAVGCFRHVGWPVLADPVDYRTGLGLTPHSFDLGRNLTLVGYAAREWIGLVAYRLSGRIDNLYPAPELN